jgi:hypothetical protein
MATLHEWDEAMGEISGFGGGYEAVCRSMVLAGIAWVEEHPEADPHFSGFKDVYGILMEDNADAKAMVEAMMAAPVYLNGVLIQKTAREDCTGAMHQASCSHVMAFKRLGWDAYCEQLRQRERDEKVSK